MQVFVQNTFKIRGSEAGLSDDDASAFAWRAVAHLDNGAFLLHPHTLARACYAVSFSFSPCVLARLHCPVRISIQLGALSAAKQVRRCSRGCCAWLAPLYLLTPPVWCGSTAHNTRPHARMFCDTPCRLQSLLVCHCFRPVHGELRLGIFRPRGAHLAAVGPLPLVTCASELPPRPCESLQGNPGIPPRSFIRFSRCRTARRAAALHVSGPCDTACIVHQR